MKRIFKISALLLCIIFVLSGCHGKGKVADANNSLNMNIGGGESSSESENSSQEASSNNSSGENTKNKNDSGKNTSSKNTSSKNNQSNTQSENTSSNEFPSLTVQGGTVIGTTSKGYEIKVKNGITYINGVLIVNKTYSLPENYNPGINSVCNRAFNQMKAAAKKNGVSIWISSGFRSYKTQKSLYESYCKRDGVQAADRYSARPGHSEHQSGLAIDVNSGSTVAFETTYKQVGEWLEEHCWEYGFIIRYPDGKEHITGYKYEPWHIRYVGTELSMQLKLSGQTLEEYFGITSSYTSDETPEDNNSSTGSEDGNDSSTESGDNDEPPTDSEDNTSSTESEDNNSSTESEENNESATDLSASE